MKLNELGCEHTLWTWIQSNTPMSKKELTSLSHRHFNILQQFCFLHKKMCLTCWFRFPLYAKKKRNFVGQKMKENKSME